MDKQSQGRLCRVIHSAKIPVFLLVCSALLWGWTTLYASATDEEDLPGSGPGLHEPLSGQPCMECHKEAVSLKTRCLLAGGQMCVLCHEIPAEGGQAGLMEPSAPLCFTCHAKEGFDKNFVHGPFAAGACLTCHSPHGGDGSAMVRVAGRRMCLACHDDMEAGFAGARFRHMALATGCTGCHSPHTSMERYQLREPAPYVCAECHEDIFRSLETAAVIHSPVKEESACLNCHSPHVAQNDGLLRRDDMDTCLECHNEPIEVGEYELVLMGQLLEEKNRHHGPIQFRECSECHNPHGSPYFRLLTDAYPERLYTPFFESSYALCFRCHEPTLASEEQTDSLTGFRDGNLSLHYLHVNKTSMGRTCRLCHEAHASSQPYHIRESVPFGTWDLPIKFRETENGGSCEPGCHAEKSYDRLGASSVSQ